jgi:predicted RNA-binding protein with PIN domain
MPILIDGHNLIGKLPGLSLEDADDEEQLIRLLQSHRARTGKSITVVFDPGTTFALSQSVRLGGVEVVFAPHGSSADAVISRRVRRARDRRGWLVVTSDRELAAQVSHQGARVQDAADFARQLGSSGASPPEADGEPPTWKTEPLSPEDVDKWLALFGEQD